MGRHQWGPTILCTVLFYTIIFPNICDATQYLSPSNQSEAYFNGSSYIRLQTTISLKRQLGLSFRTCSGGGRLFSQQQKDDLIELYVDSQGVIFYAKTEKKSYQEKVSGDFLDNRWHTVHLDYILGNLTITVDDTSQLIANASFRNDLLTNSNLYTEGTGVLLIGKGFKGCLLEGPSIVFDPTVISFPFNVAFEPCPLPYDSCTPREKIIEYDYCINEPCLRHGTCINNKTTYTCLCLPRYTGKNCEIDLGNPCDKKPCRNSGTCFLDPSGDFSCVCAPGFTGRQCEQEIRKHPQCKTNPCLNGGTCDVEPDFETVVCRCRPGYGGSNCEKNLDECASNPCMNGGQCIDGFNNFTCVCDNTGYEGKLCEKNINECMVNPCSNRGICFDTYGSYICQCLPGYQGQNCQFNIDECASHPCFNNGVCISKPPGYECRCLNGYLGDNCEIEQRQQRLCDDVTCGPYAICMASGDCVCKPEFPGVYPECLGSAVCNNNPCKNGGRCTPYKGYYNCTCLPGFTGKNCQIDINDCVSSPCQNGGTCIDSVDDYFCNCTEDFMGKNCEEPYNPCELGVCKNNSTCTLLPNKRDYMCSCLSGFEGQSCEINIDDCVNNNCPQGQICVDLINKYECRCPPGFVGDDCTIDLDLSCSQKNCQNGTCIVDKLTNQPSCSCQPGYTGNDCETDINECLTFGPKICNNGICVNTEGSYQCYCMPGFTGEQCELDFDECLSMPCKNNATCRNLINNYECKCPPGYEGKDCSVNIDECAPRPCMMGSTCIDGINEFRCICLPGLTGKLCDINIDDCESSPCLNGAKCIDGLNSYKCDCADTGYEGNHCENNIDDCQGNPCENGAECVDKVKDYQCNCYRGYTGKNCETDINECDSSPCQYNGICLEKSNITLFNPDVAAELNITLPEAFNRPFNYSDAAGYECVCVKGVTGANCETNINECESNPCHFGTCSDKIGGYDCECEAGYEGQHCEKDIDECERYTPCVNGKCIDKIANYYCHCNPNYGGKNCSVELTGCVGSPCKNNGKCSPFLINENEHKFNCTCPNGFYGSTCENITTMSLSGNSLVTVSTTRDEGYDIQFRFKTTLGDGLLALGKGNTFYILELSSGRLNLQSSLLNKWEGVFIGSNLNDSNWHKVFVAINSTHLVLSANEEQTIYPIFNDYTNGSASTSFPVTYIGAIPSNLRKLTHGQPFFVGCTEDVLINNEWVLPQTPNASWLTFQNIDIGCIREPQCNPNPCHSGGRCTDRWRDFSCTCERPYLGNTCQYNYTAATFGYENITESMVVVNVTDYARRAVRTIVDISMFIKTRQAKGHIFYVGSGLNLMDETYIAAQLESGELLVRIRFNGSAEAYTVGGVKLNNGYNHLIEVIRNVTLVQVKLNGTEYFRKTISATGILDAQVLFLGGLPQVRSVRQATEQTDAQPTTAAVMVSTLASSVNFKGIIQDVQVSNGSAVMVVEFFPLKVPDLDLPPPFGAVTFDNTTVLPGVLSDDLCRSVRCLHNGVCENTWNDYQCKCTRGFKGKNCDEQEFCELEGCPTGSECKNLEDGYECIANSTYDGTQQPLVYQYEPKTIPSSTENNNLSTLEVTYRTRSWGTILFAKYKSNYFVIFIYHNEVVVEWNFDGVLVTQRFRKDRFEGQWLSLYFIVKDKILIGGFRDGVVDELPNFEVPNFDVLTFTELFKNGKIYVAGSDGKTFNYKETIANSDHNMTGYIPVPDSTTSDPLTSNSLETGNVYSVETLHKVDQNKKTDGFKGCLGEIRIGGLLLPFFSVEDIYHNRTYAEELFELVQETRPEIGCILCYDQDCSGQGKCINNTQTYKCDCNAGYAADDCSIDINECENNQCENNATCVDLVARYECSCLTGYTGDFCEIDINECQSSPCKHGGTCLDLIGTFKCECPEDFVGKQCEAPLLITCDNKPCRDGATCKTGQNELTQNNFTCICTEGMEGILCDTAFCETKPCENNGFCNKNGDVPYCECLKGFEGKFCEVNIDDCVVATGGTHCLNGGICIDGINRYDCNCTGTGFTGLLCGIDIDECNETNACGTAGICENLPGSYRCTCEIPGKCGHQCVLDDPCFVRNPCEHGICISKCVETEDYVCKCEDNWIGKNCTQVKEAVIRASEGINIFYIIVPIVIVILAAFAVGMAVLVNVARSKRATRGTYSPSAQEFCNPRVELDNVLKPPPEERLI